MFWASSCSFSRLYVAICFSSSLLYVAAKLDTTSGAASTSGSAAASPPLRPRPRSRPSAGAGEAASPQRGLLGAAPLAGPPRPC
eukprot:CAMPEP_0180368876 /NCGR_PEP_ID=MMETSP0989-20121125/17876_1 /TAXON_ID=697907 /ORGANISM="non described non described, Strain CCMP2293" /LENGTH=83 /DNA_ID=CAMNT_0022363575 /DNA_START=375 /DNA_END=623 /DNA_ORIENTATION=-